MMLWILFMIIFTCYIVWLSARQGRTAGLKATKKRHLKKIYIWNSPDRIESAAFGVGHEAFLANKCPISDCTIVVRSSTSWHNMTQSRFQMLETFDAVLFHIHELWVTSLPPDYYRRPSSQRFVFLTQESPLSMDVQLEEYNNYFNWTMSYRRDSDIKLLYGRFHTLNHSADSRANQLDSHNTRRKKTKKVAWMVSHCQTHSKREDYVRQLQEHIQVDIYGECGSLKCTRNATHWLSNPECYDKLANDYKFYLSFENSICQDYVTEKLFNILQHDMVPVVLGGADYLKIAPPHSYIDTAWFASPADLANYLLHLDSHDDQYDKYFDWKKHFSVEAGVEQMARHAFCDLCAKLHDPDQQSKTYPSLVPQWSAQNQCNHSKV